MKEREPTETTAALLSEAKVTRDLLRAYGDVNECPTEAELATGCADAARLIEKLRNRLSEVEGVALRASCVSVTPPDATFANSTKYVDESSYLLGAQQALNDVETGVREDLE